MYEKGHGSSEIVKYLNSKKYLSPTGYRKTGEIQNENNSNYRWNEVTICNILKNEVYIGNTVQNKKTVVSYKVKKIRAVKKENQIRVNNTHEPIIDKETFNKVQTIIVSKSKNTKLKYDYLLRGLLYCYHCERKLQIVLKNNSKKNSISHPYITCSNAKKRGCYPLNINYKKFEEKIIKDIKKICYIYKEQENFNSCYKKDLNKILEVQQKIKRKIDEINIELDKMYIDKLKGILSENDYLRYSRKDAIR